MSLNSADLILQVWQYEGSNTLGGYLKRRDCIPGLAQDLGVSEAAAVPTVMKQIFENLVVSCCLPCAPS